MIIGLVDLTNEWNNSNTLLNTGAGHAKFLLYIIGSKVRLKIFQGIFIILSVCKIKIKQIIKYIPDNVIRRNIVLYIDCDVDQWEKPYNSY